MKTKKGDYPFQIKISFEKLFDVYRTHLNSENPILQQKAKIILDVAEKYPILSEGLTTSEDVEKHMPQIHLVMEDMFTSVLGANEIKVATVPFQNLVLKSSDRYKKIIKAAGEVFTPDFGDFDPEESYIMACSLILNRHYGSRADFRRPIFYKIPDINGVERSYKMLYNADFMSIYPTEKSVELTEEDITELIDNFDNISLWKEKFPPESWLFKG
ncbi:MAG: GAF domain-containing protein, partial [Flavobacteriaceae bacterium]|nr:GAF domain-containing protein [Flavobacteriaceae bacterium]